MNHKLWYMRYACSYMTPCTKKVQLTILITKLYYNRKISDIRCIYWKKLPNISRNMSPKPIILNKHNNDKTVFYLMEKESHFLFYYCFWLFWDTGYQKLFFLPVTHAPFQQFFLSVNEKNLHCLSSIKKGHLTEYPTGIESQKVQFKV